MTDSIIKIGLTYVPIESIPDVIIYMEKGVTTYIVEVTIDAAFSSAIITACTIGATVTIKVGSVTYSGTVNEFLARSGHSMIKIVNATAAV